MRTSQCDEGNSCCPATPTNTMSLLNASSTTTFIKGQPPPTPSSTHQSLHHQYQYQYQYHHASSMKSDFTSPLSSTLPTSSSLTKSNQKNDKSTKIPLLPIFQPYLSSIFPTRFPATAASSSSSSSSSSSVQPLSLWSLLTSVTHTFAWTTFDTCHAAVQHVCYGPPHTSWNLLTTVTRAALRRVMLCNPPEAAHSFPLIHTLMQFTYPVSPTRYQIYSVWYETDVANTNDHGVQPWHDMQMTTVQGQAKGHRIAAEFVTAVGAVAQEGGEGDGHAQLVLYVHGGAFHFMSARTHRYITTRFVKHTHATVLAINQRLGPHHSFSASVEDVMLCYLSLIGIRPCRVYATTEPRLSNLNVSGHHPAFQAVRNDPQSATPPAVTQKIWLPHQIVFAGDSSGGNTVVSALLVLKAAGYPLPQSAILLSPWLDPPCTIGRTSWTENRDTCFLPTDLPGLSAHFETFCQPFPVTHPLVCPLYATQSMLQGLPPLLLQVGHHEALRDESVEWGECVIQAGGRIRVEVFDGSFHAFHAFQFLPQGHSAFRRIQRWMQWVRSGEPEDMAKVATVEWVKCEK